jgi:DivIVA domain-containing protein
MNQEAIERSRFAIVMRGYDRDQVDAILEACERWAREAQAHMDGTDTRLSETDRKAEALEGRLAELEERGSPQPPRSLQVLSQRAEDLLGRTREAAEELQTSVEAEAQSDRERTERAAGELKQEAKTRAGKIAASARRRQEEAAPSTQSTRRQAVDCIEEGRTTAAQRADAVRQRAEGPMRQVRQELDRLEKERLAALEELAALQQSLEDLVGVS